VVHELVAARLHRIERLGRRKARGFFRWLRRRRIVRDVCVLRYPRDVMTLVRVTSAHVHTPIYLDRLLPSRLLQLMSCSICRPTRATFQ
jgi:hypothetical protein